MTAAEGTAGEDGKKAMLVGGREKGQNHKSLLSSSALYQYILETSVYPREVECMKELREITAKHPLNGIASSADVVQFIAMLLKLINAKNTIEVGVFTGYSLLATALALPDDGKIVAIDMDRETFKLGLPVIEKTGVAHKVDFREGLALPLLQDMVEDEKYRGSFDFVFVDADKCNYANYHNAAVELVRVGGVMAYDNTLWNGSVVAPPEVVMPEYILKSRPYIMAFNEYLAGDNRVEICHLSVGDGLTLCRRRQ